MKYTIEYEDNLGDLYEETIDAHCCQDAVDEIQSVRGQITVIKVTELPEITNF